MRIAAFLFILFLFFSGNAVAQLYRGGNGNGFSKTSSAVLSIGIIDATYNGGPGKGETVSSSAVLNLSGCGNIITWTGAISNVWSNGANWSCGFAPGIANDILIPSGLARYPTVFNAAEVKSIALQTGATITVKQNVQLKINGE